MVKKAMIEKYDAKEIKQAIKDGDIALKQIGVVHACNCKLAL